LADLRVEEVSRTGQTVRIVARAVGGRLSARAAGQRRGGFTAGMREAAAGHGRGRLRGSHLPGGPPVPLPFPDCPKATFAEQVSGLTSRHARRTPAVTAMLQAVALALGGRAGARLSGRLAAGVSRMTLIRLVRAMPVPDVDASPRVLGVDLSGVLSHPSVTSVSVA
jgi:hypothetical protein